MNPKETQKSTPTNSAGLAGPRLIQAEEVARLVSVSTRTLWRLVSTRQFPLIG